MVNTREKLTNSIAEFQSCNSTEWHIADAPVDYPNALSIMEQRVKDIAEAHAKEAVWLLEHPPLYTAGTSANEADLLNNSLPVYKTGRGGQYTYHGPGQRIAYIMLDLNSRHKDVRKYITALEEWIIQTLWTFHIRGERREDRVGVWVRTGDTEAKIAALGIRLKRWVSFHGISINIDPDLTHYRGIVPCGVQNFGTTSLHKLGALATMEEVDIALKHAFEEIFGPVIRPEVVFSTRPV